MLNKVKSTIEKSAMLAEQPCHVTVALSGGADSVALLYSLYMLKDETGIILSACHVNHNLRGEESDRDEMFCRRLCRQLDIPLYVRNVKVLDYVTKHRSVEQCARDIRYSFFSSIYGKRYIATAHTASDNIETMLINMTRGTALSGVCGIPVKRNNIIRPLIGCTREEIETFCKKNCLSYVTDSTNLSDDYTRNKVRHSVIPVLKQLNPSVEAAFSRLSQLASDDDEFLDRLAIKEKNNAEKDGKYSVKTLNALDDCILRRIVTMILDENSIPVSLTAVNSCMQIIRAEKGKINPSQYKFVMIRKKHLTVITDKEKFRKTN